MHLDLVGLQLSELTARIGCVLALAAVSARRQAAISELIDHARRSILLLTKWGEAESVALLNHGRRPLFDGSLNSESSESG